MTQCWCAILYKRSKKVGKHWLCGIHAFASQNCFNGNTATLTAKHRKHKSPLYSRWQW